MYSSKFSDLSILYFFPSQRAIVAAGSIIHTSTWKKDV